PGGRKGVTTAWRLLVSATGPCDAGAATVPGPASRPSAPGGGPGAGHARCATDSSLVTVPPSISGGTAVNRRVARRRPAAGQTLDHLVQPRRAPRRPDLGLGGVRPAEAHVLLDGAVEEIDVLENDGDPRHQFRGIHRTHVHT